MKLTVANFSVTVMEVLPKDKKGKEEKTNVLGQSCIDLLPLLRGKQILDLILYKIKLREK